MARLNGLVTVSGRGIYWQLIDAGGPEVLTVAVGGPTLEEFKELLKVANVRGFWPPEDDGDAWTIDLDIMNEHANAEGTSSGFPGWARGRVSVKPSSGRGGVLFYITPDMLGDQTQRSTD